MAYYRIEIGVELAPDEVVWQFMERHGLGEVFIFDFYEDVPPEAEDDEEEELDRDDGWHVALNAWPVVLSIADDPVTDDFNI